MRPISPEKKQQIINAAEALVSKGTEKPTNDQVRDFMGGGSIADISPVMREWRSQQQKQTSSVFTMPDSVKASGERFISQLWSAADTESRRALNIAQAEFSTQVRDIASERDEALTEVARLDEAMRKLSSELELAQSKLATSEQQTQEQAKLYNEAKSDLKVSIVQVEAANKRADDLASSLKECQTQQQNLQAELIALAKNKTKS